MFHHLAYSLELVPSEELARRLKLFKPMRSFKTTFRPISHHWQQCSSKRRLKNSANDVTNV